jgi:SAM-dependent methyltransferase/glycosyltransferase involved in cell wall biosynthesis
MSSITAHMLVKNDDYFVWYAINSVLPYVDQFFITDTGSTDQTLALIKSINSPKIILQTVVVNTPQQLVEMRNRQLSLTASEWIWLVDADEVYTATGSAEMISMTEKAEKDVWGIVVPFYNFVGDIYHVQLESKGRYQFGDNCGHLNLRVMRNLDGMQVTGVYPLETYEFQGKPLQNYAAHLDYAKTKFFHAGNLNRSTANQFAFARKFVIDKGIVFDPLPSGIFENVPAHVPQVLTKRSLGYEIAATVKFVLQSLRKPQSQPISAKQLSQHVWNNPAYYQTAEAASQSNHIGVDYLVQSLTQAPLLEIGCGEGSKLSRFLPPVKIGIDISITGVEKLAEKNISGVIGDAASLPFKSASFGSAVSLFSLEHVLKPESVVSEMIRVLKRGGMLGIVAPNFGAPNRASPCFTGNRMYKLLSGFALDLFRFKNSRLEWYRVIPKALNHDYQPDYDTTVEPYVRTLNSFLISRGLKVKYVSSLWEVPVQSESKLQQTIKWLGIKNIYPFKYWGPHLLVLAEKI